MVSPPARLKAWVAPGGGGGAGEGVPPAPPCCSLETGGFLAVVAAATWAGAGSQEAWGGDGAPELNTVWGPQLPHLWGNVVRTPQATGVRLKKHKTNHMEVTANMLLLMMTAMG